ncbi:hypothetical protein [Curtobacterium sp. MCBD17_028]|uniref:hypothetical protein n=1 Tax=Curtobacterium sp. MCBD17_028 TaxID=2175670 RepID=UPI000DA8C30C|nr:hypothetical protein [Curtobacterium sp. MCBD17_028]PZE23847.1 hypothetical protein DEI86_13455 [Curtobacterium sp. MCBD17_028]
MDVDSFVQVMGAIAKVSAGVLGPFAAAWGTVKVAQIRARRNPAEQQRADNETSRVTIETFEAFKSEYLQKINDLREDVDRLKTAVTRATRVLRILREAFRQYIRDVAHDWGRTDKPPTIADHIRDMLIEDDLDNTFSDESMQDLRDQVRKTTRTTSTADPSDGSN